MVKEPLNQSVCVVGLGYIGLPTASLLATRGYEVFGVDVNDMIVEALKSGTLEITEPDLDVLVSSAINSGRLQVGDKPVPADVYIITVPTPTKARSTPDMSMVEAAAQAVAPVLKPGALVILESTSPVGATNQVGELIAAARPDLALEGEGDARIYVAHSPERVLPGQILKELVGNDRLVGGLDAVSTEKCAQFYRSFVSGQVRETDARSAELAKLVENAYRDVNIAFANELSMVCEDLDLDVWQVIDMANCHPRVNILNPGPGVGGHCIAVDPWFIISAAPEASPLMRTAREVNDAKPLRVVDQVLAAAADQKDPVIACLGLAYKADVDDLRESPAVEIVEQVAAQCHCTIMVVEPHIDAVPPQLAKHENLEFTSLEQAIDAANIIVLLVDHRQFLALDRTCFDGKSLIDTRGIFRDQVPLHHRPKGR